MKTVSQNHREVAERLVRQLGNKMTYEDAASELERLDGYCRSQLRRPKEQRFTQFLRDTLALRAYYKKCMQLLKGRDQKPSWQIANEKREEIYTKRLRNNLIKKGLL